MSRPESSTGSVVADAAMAALNRKCQWCGSDHMGQCPKVSAVEYFPNGTIKRVEFHHGAQRAFGDFTQPTSNQGWGSISSTAS